MSDLQFVIKKEQIKENTKEIFAKIISTDTIATYALNFQAR